MIICADDYGLRDDIDGAILELAATRRLSAISCLVALERCDVASVARLLEHQAAVDVGLHLCLTDEGLQLARMGSHGLPLPFPKHGELAQKALLRRLAIKPILSLISIQYQLFLKKAGRRPDFIDGHLHVHQLPIVRDALVDFVASLPEDARPYIRNTRMPLGKIYRQGLPWSKAAVIHVFGARLKRKLQAAGFSTNDGFAGVYDFRHWSCYQEYFPKFAACLPQRNSLLVVHPGTAEAWRRAEFETLQTLRKPPNRFQR